VQSCVTLGKAQNLGSAWCINEPRPKPPIFITAHTFADTVPHKTWRDPMMLEYGIGQTTIQLSQRDKEMLDSYEVVM
jgi:hypothetical protein